MLYQLGGLTIDTAPFEVHDVTREYGGTFAAKDVIGVMRPREFTGEDDEKMTLVGRIMPFSPLIGGLNELEALEAMARSGEPQILVRGDGRAMGWMLIDKVREKSSHLLHGIGRVIEYDISLVRTPQPGQGSIVGLILQLLG